MKQDYSHDPDLKNIVLQFRSAVKKRWQGLRQDRALHLAAPTAAMSAAVSIPFFLNTFQHIPPGPMRAAAVIGAFLAPVATLAYPLVRDFKAASPFIKKDEVIKSMDSELGHADSEPTKQFDDVPVTILSPSRYLFWKKGKLRLWDKYGDDIVNLPRIKPFQNYYGGHTATRTAPHVAIFAAAALSAAINADHLQENWNTAWDWTPPPVPLAYTVQIKPPEKIEGVNILTDMAVKDAIQTGEALSPHDRSTIIINSDRRADISVDGTIVPLTEEDKQNPTMQFRYSFMLNSDVKDVVIDHEYTIRFDIQPDEKPKVNITNVGPSEFDPSVLEMQYEIGDDYGVTGAKARIKVINPETETEIEPKLEVNEFPDTALPY